MVKALKRELPSVLAIYHIMHKRADTIGCVWLAYCINSFYNYFRKVAPCKSKFHPARHFSSIPSRQSKLKKGGVKMKFHPALYSISLFFLFVKFVFNNHCIE